MNSVYHLCLTGVAVEVLAPAHKTLLMVRVHVAHVLRQLAGLSVTPHR